MSEPTKALLELANETGIHPGLVVMPLASMDEERAWMRLAIEQIEEEAVARGIESAALMINKVAEIDESRVCALFEYPDN